MSPALRFAIRPSTVAAALLCPARAGLRGHPRYSYYPNEGLFFGTLTHACVERTILTGFGTDGLEEFLLTAAPMLWEKELVDAPAEVERVPFDAVLSRGQRLALYAEVVEATERWLVQAVPNIETGDMEVEQTISRHVGTFYDDSVGQKVEVHLEGTPDLYVSRPATQSEIIDWKTAGKNWNKDKVSTQLQRVAYPWMAWDAYDGEVNGYPDFTYWVYDRGAEWWVSHTAPEITDEEITALSLQTMAMAKALYYEAWTYAPTGQSWKGERGWHCSPKYCNAWDACQGKHLIADETRHLEVPTLIERMTK